MGFFKYYDFFLDNFVEAFSFFGVDIHRGSLSIVLPVGISFYTFQTLSYTIDIYRNTLRPTRSFLTFAAFVAFFPQLVAGPIERAANLIPQFSKERQFDYHSAVDGLRQILWGLIKKMVIADNCAVHANQIFNHYSDYSGSTLLLGAIFFSFQIYGDFSGYSDIAIGTGRLLGFNLMKNFSFPYFSRDIAEFWRRWHISLTTWFRDYLYIPLGGSRGNVLQKVKNTFIIFLVSGFWHGANWTFIFWGALNALLFLPLLLTHNNRKRLGVVAEGKPLPSLMEVYQMASTFLLTALAWVAFRAQNIEQALGYYSTILSKSLLEFPWFPGMGKAMQTIGMVCLFLGVEWAGREQEYAIANLDEKWVLPARWLLYYCLVIAIFLASGQQQEFIYFQF